MTITNKSDNRIQICTGTDCDQMVHIIIGPFESLPIVGVSDSAMKIILDLCSGSDFIEISE